MILAVLAPRLMMKSTIDVDLLKFTEFSIFVKFLIRHKGLPPTQKIAGEQNNRTLTECKTHNFLTGVGDKFLVLRLGGLRGNLYIII